MKESGVGNQRTGPASQDVVGGAESSTAGSLPPGGVVWLLKHASCDERNAAIELLEARFEEMSDGHPDHTEILIQLANLLIFQAFASDRSLPRLDRLRHRLSTAITRPGANEQQNALAHCLLGMADGLKGLFEPNARLLESAIERLQRAADITRSHLRIRGLTRIGLICLLHLRYVQQGEREYLDTAVSYARELAGYSSKDTVVQFMLIFAEYLLILAPVGRNPDQVDEELLDRTITALEALLTRVTDSQDELRISMLGSLQSLRVARASFGGVVRDSHELTEASDRSVELARAIPRSNPHYPAELAAAGNARIGQGLLGRNAPIMTEGIDLLAEAYAAATHLPELRRRMLLMLGLGLRLRYDITMSRDDLNGAISYLEEARRTTEEELGGSDLGATLHLLAFGFYERNDANLRDRSRAVEIGLSSLRERSARVMLQNTADHALDAAMDAAGEPASVARWCIAAENLEAAVEALERGRGMVLHAASISTTVSTLLRETGHENLATEWEKALTEAENTGPSSRDALPDVTSFLRAPAGAGPRRGPPPEVRIPSDLRYRLLQALTGTGLDRMLAPPPVAHIAEALRMAGARALVYLLPQEETHSVLRDENDGGFALVVDADDGIRQLPLPLLTIATDSPAARFAKAQHDLYGVPDPAVDARSCWENALGEVCGWAWTAAMEQVLGLIVDEPGPPARVVLVPVGDAGQVPWHAARRTVGAGDLRYACQDAIISYAASARQFTEACRRPHRPWHSAPALVLVPDSGLPKAATEIQEIYRRHYSNGVLLGGTDTESPPATPRNVRHLLPRRDSAGASLLHLGCHAQPAPHPVDGRFLLQGNEPLSMRDILNQARARPRDEAGGLVILAACGSDLAERSHDEALTLATSLLAAGAAGAVGSRWPVEDLPTMGFMYMFHHYLNSGYGSPATALRAAQLWMLNPDRPPPPGLTPSLAGRLRRIDLAMPGRWAAFTYQGQ
jgi:hypothetical protein